MKLRQTVPVLLITATLLPALLASGQEPRPSAMRLFPHETLMFVRVAHGRELHERFRQTGFGSMLQDPAVSPLVEDTLALAGQQFDENSPEEANIAWEDLSRIPKGEIAFGVIDRGEADMGVLLLADFDGEQQDLDFFLERLSERWEAEGMVVEEIDVNGDTLTVVRQGDNRSSSFGYLVKEACIVGSNDEALLRHLLDRWAGRIPMVEAAVEDEDQVEAGQPLRGEQPLADNKNFQTILRECSTQLEEPPQIVFYIDPIALAKRSFRGNAGATLAFATFPALGLDGILAAGGTMTFATEKWDAVAHLHLLLGHPRSGVLTLLRFKSGDVTPPSYVPANVYGYSTTYMDAPGVYERLVQLVDQFRYDGAFEESIESNISNNLGVDFKEVVINNLAGRATLVTSYDEPARPLGEQRAFCVTLVEPTLAAKALDKIAEKYPNSLELKELGGVSYYLQTPSFARDQPEEERIFSPCYAIVDDTLILCSSQSMFTAMIEAHQESRPRLADSIEFKVIQSRVDRLTRGRELAMFYYENAAESIKHWYEVSQSDTARDGLAALGENSGAAAGLLDVLERNELPPFDVMQRYLVPTGGYLIDTDTGLHFMSFNVRRDESE